VKSFLFTQLTRRQLLTRTVSATAASLVVPRFAWAVPALPRHEAFSAGDVFRTQWADTLQALPLGSGRCGGSFDAWGLQNVGRFAPAGKDAAPTVLLHKEHWLRDEYVRDNFMDVARLAWNEAPPTPTKYAQHLDLYNGHLATQCGGEGWSYDSQVMFHPGMPDVLALRIRKQGALPALALVLESQELETIDSQPHSCVLRLRNANCNTIVCLRVVPLDKNTAQVRTGPKGAVIDFDGEALLLVGISSDARRKEVQEAMNGIVSADEHFAAAAQAGRNRFGASWILLPDAMLQGLWARSLYYALICHNERHDTPAATCGLTGIKWRALNPQDYSYLAPALLRMGHTQLVKQTVEFYHRHLKWQEEITARTYRRVSDKKPARGAMWTWFFPIGDGADIYIHGAPNHFYYEIHNAAYPARVAWDTARFLGDKDWLADIAWPVIEASARFYESVLERGADGLWGIHVIPSMGQDEYGGPDAPDYLCALYAARYTLTIALAAAARAGRSQPEHDKWRTILKEGIALERLRHRPTGMLVTNRNVVDGSNFGMQKHPIQMHPLVLTPLPGKIDPDGAWAFELRDQICIHGKERPHWSAGWTLGTYWVAATRLSRPDDLREMLAEPTLRLNCDREMLSFRSGVDGRGDMYYLAVHALYMQALQDGFADDTFGTPVFGKLAALWPDAKCHELHLDDGRRISGVISKL
jgi:hypothetical protein